MVPSARRLLGIVATCLPLVSSAIPLTFSFTGKVTDDPFGLTVFGAPIIGSYTFDSAAADSIPAPSTGSFASSGAAYGFNVSVDGVVYSIANAVTVNTANGIGAGIDQYGAIASTSALTLEVFLQDSSGTALASDAMPTAPPILAKFDTLRFHLFSDDAEFTGTIDTLACSAGCRTSSVPEPGAPLLVALGLAALWLARTVRSDRIPLSLDRRPARAPGRPSSKGPSCRVEESPLPEPPASSPS